MTTRERIVEVCLYLSENGAASSKKTRTQDELEVVLLTARGAEPVATEDFSSREPDPCPQFANEDADLGSAPYGAVRHWLRQFVNT